MPVQVPTLEEIRDVVRAVVREELKGLRLQALSTAQVAELTGRSTATVRAWVASGQLPASRRGRALTVRREDLERFLAGEEDRWLAKTVESLTRSR